MSGTSDPRPRWLLAIGGLPDEELLLLVLDPDPEVLVLLLRTCNAREWDVATTSGDVVDTWSEDSSDASNCIGVITSVISEICGIWNSGKNCSLTITTFGCKLGFTTKSTYLTRSQCWCKFHVLTLAKEIGAVLHWFATFCWLVYKHTCDFTRANTQASTF